MLMPLRPASACAICVTPSRSALSVITSPWKSGNSDRMSRTDASTKAISIAPTAAGPCGSLAGASSGAAAAVGTAGTVASALRSTANATGTPGALEGVRTGSNDATSVGAGVLASCGSAVSAVATAIAPSKTMRCSRASRREGLRAGFDSRRRGFMSAFLSQFG